MQKWVPWVLALSLASTSASLMAVEETSFIGPEDGLVTTSPVEDLPLLEAQALPEAPPVAAPPSEVDAPCASISEEPLSTYAEPVTP
jgi:hypothetical protein